MIKALFTEDFHPVIYDKFGQKGIECHIFPDIDYHRLQEKISDFDILIINSKIYIDKGIVDKAPKLKIIGRVGSGLDVIDLKYCENKGIKIYNSPEGNANAVAEHTLGMILAVMNNIFIAHHQMLDDEWKREENRGEELCGKTVSIIGYGEVGSRVAALLEPFNVQVLINDIIEVEDLPNYIKQVTMEEIFKKSDIVSLHLPLDEDTRYFADEIFFKSFHKPICFVNTSRGKIADTLALLDALEGGIVKTAMLDVYEDEPLTKKEERFQKFMSQYRLICTPHIAGWSTRSKYELSSILADKILKNGYS